MHVCMCACAHVCVCTCSCVHVCMCDVINDCEAECQFLGKRKGKREKNEWCGVCRAECMRAWSKVLAFSTVWLAL